MNIIDQNALLTSEQKDLLRENANKTYSFGDFISLDDIVRRLKVDLLTTITKWQYCIGEGC